MRKTLEQLYYGNLRPSEQRIAAGSELRRAMDIVSRREEQLESQLDEAGQKILAEMLDAHRRWIMSQSWKISFWVSGWVFESWPSAWTAAAATRRR